MYSQILKLSIFLLQYIWTPILQKSMTETWHINQQSANPIPNASRQKQANKHEHED